MKKKVLLAIAFAVASCIASPETAGDHSVDAGASTDTNALTAEDQGLELMLPFSPNTSRTLTRAYGRQTHSRHGDAYWDDSFALDFASEGCDGWGAPVLAAENGKAMTLPVGVTPGSESATSYERSYGATSVIVDHGNGCYSQYAHLSSREVSAGQSVARGQIIGREGNSGNVSGTACPAHPGTHLHFKVWCGTSAIVPEPLSGYHGLQGFVGKRFAHRALHHPQGTLIQARGAPEIYLVNGPGTIRRIADETVWRSYRFFQDRAHEWATVVPVSREEVECHDQALELKTPAKIIATTCSDRTFIAFDDGRTRWRKRILFDTSQAGHRILMRSWGFAPNEIVRSSTWACAIPASTDPLPLRDGTIIEQATDNDFYVITDNGTAYRLRRALMQVLYGDGWPMVIQVPDGSVPSLVSRMDPTNREFTLADMTTCPNRRHTLETSLADGSGGAVANESPIIPVTVIPAPGLASGEELESTPQPVTPTPPPVIPSAPPVTPTTPPTPVIPAPEPAASASGGESTSPAPRTIACLKYGTTMEIKIIGPVTDTLVGPPPTDPLAIELESDRYGWSNSNIRLVWQGDRDTQNIPITYRALYPTDLGRFNFTLMGKDGTLSWFDLPDADQNGTAFTVTGDCQMVCTQDSCAISVK